MTTPRPADAPPWWLARTMRLFQPNLRLCDAPATDPENLAAGLAADGVNTLLINCGGIFAHYPTTLPFHNRHPELPAGFDFFGRILEAAHAHDIRVIGRFDLSKTMTPPDGGQAGWYFRRADDSVPEFSGTYAACINGTYYRECGPKMVEEALRRYHVDGLFFNMFGNPASDYGRRPLGPCHCPACRTRWRDQTGRELPAEPTPDYRAFIDACARDVAQEMRALIHRLRPGAGLFTYRSDAVDGIANEANTFFDHPLPLWPYHASANVEQARTTHPDKFAFNICIGFEDYSVRLNAIAPHHARLRHWQNLAHGTGLLWASIGGFPPDDATAWNASREIYRWVAEHEDLYLGQENPARILLLGQGHSESFRGCFRLLSEEHLPFAASGNARDLEDRLHAYACIIASGPVDPRLEAWVQAGGKLLALGAEPPPFGVSLPVARQEEGRGSYWRIHDTAGLDELAGLPWLFFHGPWAKLPATDRIPLLSWIPPTPTGPPELVFHGAAETMVPGIFRSQLGRGELIWLPWEAGLLYHRHSATSHRALLVGLLNQLLPADAALLQSDAHPLVEVVLRRQPHTGRTLLHLINLTGHAGTAYHPPFRHGPIRIKLKGTFSRAYAHRAAQALALDHQPTSATLTVSQLEDYEVVSLDPAT